MRRAMGKKKAEEMAEHRELFRGGLSVRTTMDPRIQAAAEAARDRRHLVLIGLPVLVDGNLGVA